MNAKAPGTHKTSLRRRLNTRRWRRKNPEKAIAHQLLNRAVAEGRITREPCQECGSTTQVHGHHNDYGKPLEVEWLCRRCHTNRHRVKQLISRLKQGEQTDYPSLPVLRSWWDVCLAAAESEPSADVREVLDRFKRQEFPAVPAPRELTGREKTAGFFHYQLFHCIRLDGERLGIYAVDEVDARCIAAGIWQADPNSIIARYVKTIVAAKALAVPASPASPPAAKGAL